MSQLSEVYLLSRMDIVNFSFHTNLLPLDIVFPYENSAVVPPFRAASVPKMASNNVTWFNDLWIGHEVAIRNSKGSEWPWKLQAKIQENFRDISGISEARGVYICRRVDGDDECVMKVRIQ